MGNRRAFWAALTLVIAITASCTTILGIDGDGWHVVDGGILCTDASSCDDMNSCTDDACPEESKQCLNVARPEGTDALAQTPGDCHKTVCTGGKEAVVIDTTDATDDLNDCTIDTCDAAGTMTAHTPKMGGVACKVNMRDGVCDGFGKCEISCGPNLPPCDDAKPCTNDSCNAGTSKCDFNPLADGVPTPGVPPMTGDCHVHLCVAGLDEDTVDDTDLPVTTSDCVTPTCTMGTPSLPNKSPGTGCNTNGGKICDGLGACAGCNVDADCSGPTDDCKHPQCTNHACGTFFTPVNTPVSAGLQTPGDCHVVVCNGSGATSVIVDDTDIKDDLNPCTSDICTNGVISHPAKASNTPCGGVAVCNGSGFCVDCVSDANCTLPKTCGPMPCGVPNSCGCCPKNCAQLGATCGIVGDTCGGTIQCNNNGKDGSETDVDCGGNVATCALRCAKGKKCSATSDCGAGLTCVEGVCCDSACGNPCQSCLAVNKVSGPDGTCGNIKNGTDPKNLCPDQGQVSCGIDGLCDGSGACRYYATGSICIPASCADSTTLNKSDTCTAAHTCMDNGTQGCGSYMCDTGPTPDVCKTTCSGNGDCAGSMFYCAAPNCVAKKANGQGCADPQECTSNICVDGRCCNMSCSGTCESCNVAGNLGTCTKIPLNSTDDNPVCGGPSDTTNVCNGTGSCLLKLGEPCFNNSNCASNNCIGGPKTCQP